MTDGFVYDKTTVKISRTCGKEHSLRIFIHLPRSWNEVPSSYQSPIAGVYLIIPLRIVSSDQTGRSATNLSTSNACLHAESFSTKLKKANTNLNWNWWSPDFWEASTVWKLISAPFISYFGCCLRVCFYWVLEWQFLPSKHVVELYWCSSTGGQPCQGIQMIVVCQPESWKLLIQGTFSIPTRTNSLSFDQTIINSPVSALFFICRCKISYSARETQRFNLGLNPATDFFHSPTGVFFCDKSSTPKDQSCRTKRLEVVSELEHVLYPSTIQIDGL